MNIEERREYNRKWRNQNREYLRKYNTQWARDNPKPRTEKRRIQDWAASLIREYGITADEYYKMSEKQRGVCAICGEPEVTGERMSVDHDHSTGRVRGLLCRRCNGGLGSFNDDPELLARAIDYVK